MATKRARALTEAVSKEMEERDLPMKQAHLGPTEGLREAHVGPTESLHKRPKLHPVRIRIPEADWMTLELLADQEGTTPSALIRKAIKELLRRQGAGLR